MGICGSKDEDENPQPDAVARDVTAEATQNTETANKTVGKTETEEERLKREKVAAKKQHDDKLAVAQQRLLDNFSKKGPLPGEAALWGKMSAGAHKEMQAVDSMKLRAELSFGSLAIDANVAKAAKELERVWQSQGTPTVVLRSAAASISAVQRLTTVLVQNGLHAIATTKDNLDGSTKAYCMGQIVGSPELVMVEAFTTIASGTGTVQATLKATTAPVLERFATYFKQVLATAGVTM